MWPFTCKKCSQYDQCLKQVVKTNQACKEALLSQCNIGWKILQEDQPPLLSNLLVANKDFTYFGFLYLEDGWDYSRKINMQGKDGVIWATYTNASSVYWWLNLDLIKKDMNEC